jgi:uncharacterized protein (DUF433 family)
MTALVHSINWIVSDPKIRSGRPIIAGTTLKVSDVAAAMIYHQQDPDGICDWFGLNLAQVYAALSYYYDHQAEIEAEIEESDRIIREAKEKGIGSRPNSKSSQP